jgi:hypothetical protein
VAAPRVSVLVTAFQHEQYIARALQGFQIGSCAPLFRRDAIHPLPGSYFDLHWGDGPLHVMAAAHGSIYRIHADGMYRALPRSLEHDRLGHREAARDCLAKSLRVEPFDARRLAEPRAERRRLALWLMLKAPAWRRRAA